MSQCPITNPTIGIIGCNGKFGRVLVEKFENRGYKIIGSDIETLLQNKEVVQQADVVIIAVDILSTMWVINEIAFGMKKEQLLMDITSVKILPCDAMKNKSRGSVIGLHPMWDPANSWNQQRLVMCPIRENGWLQWATNFFESYDVSTVEMDPDEHDRIAAVVQGITHLPTLIQADALRSMQISTGSETDQIASPAYKIKLDFIGRLLAQDPKLYDGIFKMNPYVRVVLGQLRDSFSSLINALDTTDPANFQNLFRRNSDHFGRHFTQQAFDRTNKLIELWKGVNHER